MFSYIHRTFLSLFSLIVGFISILDSILIGNAIKYVYVDIIYGARNTVTIFSLLNERFKLMLLVLNVPGYVSSVIIVAYLFTLCLLYSKLS